MADVHLLFKHYDEFASQKMIDGLPKCPICGAKAFLQGITAEGAWYGWSVGCPRYCLNDGIHGHDDNTPHKMRLAAHGFSTKYNAARWWRKRVLEYGKDKQ